MAGLTITMSYQDYINCPFSSGKIASDEFKRVEAYARTGIEYYISRILPRWKYKGLHNNDMVTAINDAVVIQMELVKGYILGESETGKTRKRETLEGYSIEFDNSKLVNSMQISMIATELLDESLRNAGLLYRGID